MIVPQLFPFSFPLGKKLGFTIDNGKLHNVSLGQGQEVVAENALDVAAEKGHWVILQVGAPPPARGSSTGGHGIGLRPGRQRAWAHGHRRAGGAHTEFRPARGQLRGLGPSGDSVGSWV